MGTGQLPIHRLHTAVCVLATASLAACASKPTAGTAPAVTGAAARVVWQPPAPGLEFLQLSMDGALPLLAEETDGDALLASNVSLGADELLRYEASYLVDANGIVAAVDDDAPALTAPDRFGGQRLGQKVELHLPDLAGLSLAVTNELTDNWMKAADGRARRELAQFSWSPGRATVNVQWAGEGPVVDASTALRCNFHSTVTVPTHQDDGRSQGLELSGSDCSVMVDEGHWAGAEARTWGLTYVWRSEAEESAAELSVVDPAQSRAVRLALDTDPGYELDLRHRRDFGSLTASGVLSLRRSQLGSVADDEPRVTDTSWAANASLTWHLPQASLTANWARGVDPLWFTPEPGRRADHFGLAVNLSHWLDDLLAGPPPRLAMNWNWSEQRAPNEKGIANNSVSVDVALVF